MWVWNTYSASKDIITTWDQCLTIHWAFPGMTQTLIPQKNQWCGPWEARELLTFGAIPANILSIYHTPYGCLLLSELRMALFRCFRVGNTNDWICLDCCKVHWVLKIKETVIGRVFSCSVAAYIKFTWCWKITNSKNQLLTKTKGTKWMGNWERP